MDQVDQVDQMDQVEHLSEVMVIMVMIAIRDIICSNYNHSAYVKHIYWCKKQIN